MDRSPAAQRRGGHANGDRVFAAELLRRHAQFLDAGSIFGEIGPHFVSRRQGRVDGCRAHKDDHVCVAGLVRVEMEGDLGTRRDVAEARSPSASPALGLDYRLTLRFMSPMNFSQIG